MAGSRVKDNDVLLQTRIPRELHEVLRSMAELERTSVAQLARRLVSAAARDYAGRSIEERVRALEVAMINFGVVPEGVVQPLPSEKR